MADIIDSEGKSEEFKLSLENSNSIAQSEKEIVGITTSQITAAIFQNIGN